MSKMAKLYDLEDRTFEFAKNVRELVKKLPKTIINIEDFNLFFSKVFENQDITSGFETGRLPYMINH